MYEVLRNDAERARVCDMAPIKRPARIRRRTYLREWREFRNLSQAKAGSMIGWDHSSVQRLESGQTPYNQDHLEMLAQVYMCEPQDLIARDPNAPGEANELARQIAAAPAAMQRQIKAVVAAMLKTGG
jgi:transcriptional regulator with XRE-family HTH domain